MAARRVPRDAGLRSGSIVSGVIAVVVPAYRERAHIAEVIRTVPPEVEVIVVVDDASPDDTAAAALAADDPRLRLVSLRHNVGAGGAVKIGHQVALAAGADICVVMDGDGQMDPAYLADLVAPVISGSAGYAKGNRFYSRDSYRGMPPVRLFGNLLMTLMMQLATGQRHVRDPLNGYTAVSAEVLRTVDLEATGNQFTFLLDLLGQLAQQRIPVVDVPMPARYGDETSHLRASAEAAELLVTPWVVAARRREITSASLRRASTLAAASGLGGAAWSAARATRTRRATTAIGLAAAGALVAGSWLARVVASTLDSGTASTDVPPDLAKEAAHHSPHTAFELDLDT